MSQPRLCLFAILIPALLLPSRLFAAGPPKDVCRPSSDIRAEIEKTNAHQPADVTDSEQNLRPYRELRDQHPKDIFVQENYQDAVSRYGVEGHLRAMVDEYNVLAMQHEGDLLYQYFYARSLMGRSTNQAISNLKDLVQEHPDFSPAHRTLAEIYASQLFRNEDQGRTEREIYGKQCPGSTLTQRPEKLPDPSPLLKEAETLLERNGSPERAMELAERGIRLDEWRDQRIRPFDWYTPEFKRENVQQLRSEYWRWWALQARSYRKLNQDQKADDLVAAMERRVLNASGRDPQYWPATVLLARLYQEDGRSAQATRKLEQLKAYLDSHPDPQKSAELNALHESLTKK